MSSRVEYDLDFLKKKEADHLNKYPKSYQPPVSVLLTSCINDAVHEGKGKQSLNATIKGNCEKGNILIDLNIKLKLIPSSDSPFKLEYKFNDRKINGKARSIEIDVTYPDTQIWLYTNQGENLEEKVNSLNNQIDKFSRLMIIFWNELTLGLGSFSQATINEFLGLK